MLHFLFLFFIYLFIFWKWPYIAKLKDRGYNKRPTKQVSAANQIEQKELKKEG